MMDITELKKILDDHNKWVYGKGGCRADLRGADLYGANLCRANLCRANLCGANLRGANLYNANLCRADLCRANLYGANLYGADLCRANLCDADLCDANLYGANLYRADLRSANNSALVEAMTIILPEGELIGWKKCKNDVVVKLLIPKKAKRSNGTGRKCRCEFAEVLDVVGAEIGISCYKHDKIIEYKKGSTVHCGKWDECRWNECSGGIHFFITREEAEAWNG